MNMAVSTKIVLFVVTGVFLIRALPFGVYTRASDSWKLPYEEAPLVYDSLGALWAFISARDGKLVFKFGHTPSTSHHCPYRMGVPSINPIFKGYVCASCCAPCHVAAVMLPIAGPRQPAGACELYLNLQGSLV